MLGSDLLCVLAIGWLAVGHSHANVILYDETVDNSIAGSSDFIDLSHLGPDLYGEPDEEVGKLVANYDPATDSRNVEELGSYVQGDILINRPGGRNGISNNAARWPKGVVPFVISGNFDAKGMQLIEQAINEYHQKTCIRFVPRMGETNYVSFESSDSGCWSSVGMIGGKQPVNLQIPGCTTLVGTVMHEMMHALGFLHEQNREDRDSWVAIRYENIKPGTKNNFEKAKKGSTNSFGVSYDYGSIMHYSSNAFSTNGRATIEAKKPVNGAKMGQRDGFSWNDMEKLNRMYECEGSKGNGQTAFKPPPLGMLPSTGGVFGPVGSSSPGGPGGPGPYFPPSSPGPYSPYYPTNGGPMFPYAPYPGTGYPGPGFGYYPYDVKVSENGEAAKEKDAQDMHN
ncbi:zinc metalloproteinase nas-1 isoform X1 [Anopheles funestus]|uniref:zinc metalloproteinase nas-1 isoform X1 n=1 Tax=Anopheles funestus TaxID=62324 RepID=UPI0020C6F05F|nr:zinc metalloproteinase nas-1 isoform X1 [Anopheles funestus]